MTSDPDDDALSWDGDSEAERPTLPKGWHAVGRGSDGVDSAAVADQVAEAPPSEDAAAAASAPEVDEELEGLSTGMLLALGAIGGVYLLYTVGWLIGGLRMQAGALFLIPSVMYTATLVIAVAAPALWFAASWTLTRGARSWVRLLALIAGVVLLVPWPFVMSGGMAA
ncbi:hypothetical protein L2X99_06770 [Microbacterium sp. KUDC0406]|uniref:hypothetical protein n=1 Tax=Microbacterium sp. KUDC0406 TaxID=2909588 RepID=UPI001F48A171|nr:hypothetical protein [Microbacterium sp. KUDC0406]UJP11239.1 hypothetical protein L2X99_06770 [Microbacterium sp. KUDC0406]